MRETGSRTAPRPLTSQVEGLKDRAALAQVWWAWEEGARVSPSFTASCRISTSPSEPSSTAFPGSRHGGYTLPAGKAGSARGRSPPSEEQSLRTRARPFLCTTFKLRMSFCILRDYKAKKNTSKEMWASKAYNTHYLALHRKVCQLLIYRSASCIPWVEPTRTPG